MDQDTPALPTRSSVVASSLPGTQDPVSIPLPPLSQAAADGKLVVEQAKQHISTASTAAYEAVQRVAGSSASSVANGAEPVSNGTSAMHNKISAVKGEGGQAVASPAATEQAAGTEILPVTPKKLGPAQAAVAATASAAAAVAPAAGASPNRASQSHAPAPSTPAPAQPSTSAAPGSGGKPATAGTSSALFTTGEISEVATQPGEAKADVGAGDGASGPKISPVKPAKSSFRMPVDTKDLTDAVKEASKSYTVAGREANDTVRKLVRALSKGGDTLTLTLDQLATVLFFVILALNLLFLPIFLPTLFRLTYSLLFGLVVGLGLSFMFYHNKKKKAEVNELLGLVVGLKGVQRVVGGLPSWFSISEKEKMEWLNDLIMEVWPFVDKGVCNMIKDITAQVMPGVLKTLPGGLSKAVKSIGFKHLTFGSAPFRVESIWVDPTEKHSLVMEVAVKWCGDPNITLAIEAATGGKMCPRVMDITFIATIRIKLSPMVDRIPGFVAAMATVPKPPMIKYRLDFGKALGGSLAPAAVTPVVNYFMKEIINKMLVWPQRIVVPILYQTEDDKIEFQRLMRRHRGVLRVCIMNVKGLKAADLVGTNDVQVEVTTDSEHFEATKVVRAKLLSVQNKAVKADRNEQRASFNEYKYVLIQEPKDQWLRMEVFDIDMLRPTKLLTGAVSSAVNGREFLGRAMYRMDEVCRNPGQNFTKYHELGKEDWGTPGGPGKGQGKLRLKLMYSPFEALTQQDVMTSRMGIVTARLIRVWDMSRVGDNLTAFVRIKCANQVWESSKRTYYKRYKMTQMNAEIKRMEAAIIKDEREGKLEDALLKRKQIEYINDRIKRDLLITDLDWTADTNAMAAFYNVPISSVVKIKVIEPSLTLTADELALKEIPVSAIIESQDVNPFTKRVEYGLWRKDVEMGKEHLLTEEQLKQIEMDEGVNEKKGTKIKIAIELRWVPCLDDPEELVEEDEVEELVKERVHEAVQDVKTTVEKVAGAMSPKAASPRA